MKKKIIRSYPLYHLIKVLLPVKKPGLMLDEIVPLVPPKFREKIDKVLQNAVGRGLCEGSPPTAHKPATSYYLTSAALKKFADIDNFEVIERSTSTATKRGNQEIRKIAPTLHSVPPKVEPESPPNISLEALNLTDQISQVIGQNAQYREVLASIHKLIGDLLNPPTKQPQPETENIEG